jgi:Fic family protein
MREHLEAINHKDAIEYVKELVSKKERITQSLVLSIHNLILRGVDAKYAGVYRDVQVMIKGSKHFPPSPFKVRELMDDFFVWFDKHQSTLHPVLLAAETHERLVTIHPFVDGNGRTARLLMNLILLQHGYVIANIKGDAKSRLAYYCCLEKAQVDDEKSDFINFIIKTEIEALNRYISIIGQ